MNPYNPVPYLYYLIANVITILAALLNMFWTGAVVATLGPFIWEYYRRKRFIREADQTTGYSLPYIKTSWREMCLKDAGYNVMFAVAGVIMAGCAVFLG